MPINLQEGTKSDPVPQGVHHAICYGVVDIGTQDSAIYEPTQKLILLFELPFERIEVKGKGNLPRAISNTYTQSLGAKSNLRKDLSAWRGRDFTPEELKGFDPKNLIGANCQLNVVHANKGGKVYANIKAIVPLSKGQQKRELENKPLYFSLADQPDLANIKFPENMPDWIQAKVKLSHEVSGKAEQSGAPQPNDTGHGGGDDSDVPF